MIKNLQLELPLSRTYFHSLKVFEPLNFDCRYGGCIIVGRWCLLFASTWLHLRFGVHIWINDLRKIFVSEKLKFLLKEFQFIKSLKIWFSMADILCHASPKFQCLYTVCHASTPMTSWICYHSNYGIIKCFTKPLDRMSYRWRQFDISVRS